MRILKFLATLTAATALFSGCMANNSVAASAEGVDEFACEYSTAVADHGYVTYGSTSVTRLTAAEASAQGVPEGYSGDVLSVVNTRDTSAGVLLDFSAEQVSVKYLQSVSFRVYVGDDQVGNNYPEVRIYCPFTSGNAWLMRYYVEKNGETDQWITITLDKDGTNFSSGMSFETISENGYLNKFELSIRAKAMNVPFYIDSIEYELLVDDVAPVITYEGDSTIYSNEGAVVELSATAMDNIDGEVPVSCIWEDGALAADGTLNQGEWTLTLRAVDEKGNVAEKPITVIVREVDREAPVINFAATEIKAVIGTVPMFNVTATDDGGSAEVSCVWSNGALDEYGALTEGTHTWTITAIDPSGNSAEHVVTVYVTTEEDWGDNVVDEEELDPEVIPPQDSEEPDSSEDSSEDSSISEEDSSVGSEEETESSTLSEMEEESEKPEEDDNESDKEDDKQDDEESKADSEAESKDEGGADNQGGLLTGCGGSIMGGSVALAAAIGAVLALKKKED